MTGLGTPVANLLVPDLVAYQGPGTTYAGPTVGPLQDADARQHGDECRRSDRCVQRVRCVGRDGGDFGTPGNRVPAAGVADRTATTQDRNRPSSLVAAGDDGVRLESLTYVSDTPAGAVPGSSNPATGWMPLDPNAIHDVALAEWTHSHAAAQTPAQAGPVARGWLPVVPAGPRTPVLQAAAVDSILGAMLASPSLLNTDGKKTPD